MDNMHLNGQIKGILYRKNADGTPGKVRKESRWINNTVTDIWKLRSLFLSKSAGTPGNALRGLSKPGTGQFASAADFGNFGVYLTSAAVTVNRGAIIPPFVTNDLDKLASNVVWWNVNNNPAEDANTLIAIDNRSRYSYKASDPFYEVRFIKNNGAATVGGICIGRDFANPAAHAGILLGEYAPTTSTTGTANYFLEHREDRTIVWKTVSAANQFSFDLRSKQMTQFTSEALNTNLANANLTGGLVVGNTVIKGVQQSSTAASVVVRLTGVTNFQTLTAQQTLDVAFPGTDLNTTRIARPVLVTRPDLNGIEVFVPMTLNDGRVQIQRALVTNFQAGLDAATVSPITVWGESPFVIGVNDTATVDTYLTGFYEPELEQYYFPYRQVVGAGNALTAVSKADFNPGIILGAADQAVRGHYLARTQNNFNAPCLTDAGVLQCRANTTTMYYFQGTGVISGASFDEPFIKDENSVFELVYRFTMQ